MSLAVAREQRFNYDEVYTQTDEQNNRKGWLQFGVRCRRYSNRCRLVASACLCQLLCGALYDYRISVFAFVSRC